MYFSAVYIPYILPLQISSFLLGIVDLLIDLIIRKQLFMRANPSDSAIFQYYDLICVTHRRDSLSYDNLRHMRQFFRKLLPDSRLCRGIHGTGGIIKNQHLWFLQYGTGYAQSLLLPS